VFEQIAIATVCVSTLASLVAFVWMFKTIHSGNGFHKEIETQDGSIRKRLDLDLICSVILGALAFGVNVLFIGDFLCLIVTEKWAFDPQFTKGSLIVVLIVFSFYVVKKLYTYTLDTAERKIHIREVEVKEEE